MKKSRIRKLMETPEKPYSPTPRAVRYWFRILNEDLFNGKLTPVDQIEIRKRRYVHAEYECEWTDDSVSSKIIMNDTFRSKQLFVNVLFHEMVHHHQALYREPLGHGPSFLVWQDKASKHGLALYIKYD